MLKIKKLFNYQPAHRLTGSPANFKNGQSIVEYAILLSALCLVFVSMSAYMQRSAQAKLYVLQTQVNDAMK